MFPEEGIQLPCSLCARTVQAKGLCATHYSAWWRENNSRRLVCDHCSATYRPRRAGQRYCKPTCQRRAAKNSRSKSYELEIHRPSMPDVPVVRGSHWTAGKCKTCGSNFVSNFSDNTCSAECRRRHQARRGLDKGHRRRSRIRGRVPENFSALSIFQRDGYVCQLCGLPVDSSRRVPEWDAPTLDHIIPIARGGAHTRDNCQLAHFICNARKSDRLEGEYDPGPKGVPPRHRGPRAA